MLAEESTATIVGLDLGDRHSHFCLVDGESGEVLEEGRFRTSPEAFERRFGSERPMRVAIEVGTHSPWVSRLLEECGHEVLVANPRKIRLIYGSGRKTDRLDAEKLARLARADPELLHPVKHRGEESRAHLALLRSREPLVRSRTQLVNHVRGTVKSFGARLPGCSARSFHKKVHDRLPSDLVEGLGPVVQTIASLTERIGDYDRRIEKMAAERYPQTGLLRQVQGVGTLTA
jgi:transposase